MIDAFGDEFPHDFLCNKEGSYREEEGLEKFTLMLPDKFHSKRYNHGGICISCILVDVLQLTEVHTVYIFTNNQLKIRLIMSK